MKKTKRMLLALVALTMGMALTTSCDEKESDLGLNLQDPSTIYNGVKDTVYDITAYTVFDDSLLTSGYSMAIIGNMTSPTYGPAEAIYYTLLGLPNEGGINFDENFHIDSIVMHYRVGHFFPSSADTSKTYNLHFEIRQTTEQLLSDTSYYAFSSLETGSNVLYNATCTYRESDTSLRFKLNDNAKQLFGQANSQAEFEEQVKGLRIKLMSDSDPAAVSINLAAISTKMTVHYRYGNDTSSYAEFPLGRFPKENKYVGHFNQFVHNYAGTPLNRFQVNPQDTLRNSTKLYLTPMGGTNIYINLGNFIRTFHAQHPYAVIHYAELLLPLAAEAEADHPDMVFAYRTSSTGYSAPIADLIDADIANLGFDGTYHADKNCYRLRISRHLQQLLRTQEDYGTLLVLNQRRTSPLCTVVNGSRNDGATNPIRIEFIYTEINQE